VVVVVNSKVVTAQAGTVRTLGRVAVLTNREKDNRIGSPSSECRASQCMKQGAVWRWK
jgi:hypothetical protein